MHFLQDNVPYSKLIKTMANINELRFEMPPTHLILEIWPLATFICSQIKRNGSRDRDFY